MNRKSIISLALSFVTICNAVVFPAAYAEEITITGNGAESVNTVSTGTQQEVIVQQTNTATITNTITATANTGNNTANNNTNGDTTITTGDASITTDITNAVNTNVVTDSCACNGSPSDTITIANNGAGSANTITQSESTDTTVSTTNNAQIRNALTVQATSGGNIANNTTGGDVMIKTGDITAKKTLTNTGLNQTKVTLAEKRKQAQIMIHKNGAFSLNTISLDDKEETKVFISNISDILTTLSTVLETGKNSANYSTDGSVRIITGDIIDETQVSTEANTNAIFLGETCKQPILSPTPSISSQPTVTPAPTSSEKLVASSQTNTTSSTNTNSNTTSNAHNDSSPIASVLPATGTNILLMLLVANAALFIAGGSLRMHANKIARTPFTF